MKKLRPITPHSIITAKLERIVNDPSLELTSASVQAELDHCYQLARGLDQYIEENTTKEPDQLALISRLTQEYDWDVNRNDGDTFLEAEMLSGHVEGQFLNVLVSATQSKKILEIGLFTGYSAISMARGFSGDGEIVACEVDLEVAKIAKENIKKFNFEGTIDVKIGPALNTLRDLSEQGAVFDLVFVDADKPNYINYVKYILDHNLVRVGGLIVADNTLLQGEVYLGKGYQSEAGRAMCDFNEYLRNETRVEQVLIPLRDGVTLAERKK